MTAAILNWFWRLASRDMASVIGISLIGLGIGSAILRKIGKWT